MKRLVCMLLILVLSVSMLVSCDELFGITADMDSIKESIKESVEESLREELESSIREELSNNGTTNPPANGDGGTDSNDPDINDPVKPPVDLNGFVIPEGGFDTNQEITITFYHTMGATLRGVLNKYIAKFNEIYPNITIEYTQVGSYDDVRDQINTEITVGNQPNIAYCYPDHVALYNISKAVLPMDVLIDSDLRVSRADGTTEALGLTQAQREDFIRGFYEEGRAFGDGKMYTLPLSKSTEVLYYNKTFFDQHNLKVPTTWDEMEAVCKKIKEIDPDCIPLGYDSEANWFITMCEQYGSPYTSTTYGENFLFDNETNRAFVERFRTWYQNGWVTTEEISGGYTSDLFTKSADEPGNCYMCIASSAGASYQIPETEEGSGVYSFEVGIAGVPQLNKENPKAISQGPSLCIFNNADPQEVLASWLFVKFLTTSIDFQANFSMVSGYMPVLKSVANNELYKSEFLDLANGTDQLQATSVKVGIEQQNAYYTSPAFNGSSVARDQVGLLMQTCFTTKTDDVAAMIKKAFEDAVAECKYQTE